MHSRVYSVVLSLLSFSLFFLSSFLCSSFFPLSVPLSVFYSIFFSFHLFHFSSLFFHVLPLYQSKVSQATPWVHQHLQPNTPTNQSTPHKRPNIHSSSSQSNLRMPRTNNIFKFVCLQVDTKQCGDLTKCGCTHRSGIDRNNE